jgi:AAA15 family ATPase/GTPase
MKIKKLHIENFKSISNFTIEEFSNLNMLFGHNNSGKSNVLKFIELIFSPKIKTETTTFDTSRLQETILIPKEQTSPFWEGFIENQPYIFRNNEWRNPILFEIGLEIPKSSLSILGNLYESLEKIYFQNKASYVSLNIIGQIEGINPFSAEMKLQEVQLEERNIYVKNPKEAYFQSVPVTDKSGIKSAGYTILYSILNLLNNSVLFLDNDRYFHAESENPSVEELTPQNFANWFHNLLLNPQRYQEYMQIIRDISLFKANGDKDFQDNELNSPIHMRLAFEFARNEKILGVILTNQIPKRLPLENFGTGIQQVLYILAKVAEMKPKILLIEEIELNLSPKYQYELIQHFKRLIKSDQICQLFFTTHNPLLACKTEFVVHNIFINKAGETTAHKLGKEKKEIQEFYPRELIEFLIEQKINKRKSS